MGRLIHVGFGNIVNMGKLIAIVSPDSAPVKRMVQSAKEAGIAIDATQGQIVLSALLPDTIVGRAQGGQEDAWEPGEEPRD